jgi:hypothetical protein
VSGRIVRFDGLDFLPYYSGANATIISEPPHCPPKPTMVSSRAVGGPKQGQRVQP